MERKAGESATNRIVTSRMDDTVRSVFAAELPFFHGQDDLVVEISAKCVQVAYTSFELSDAPAELTTMKLRFQLDTAEVWIGEINVAKPFRLQGVGRRLVRAAEIVASETGMDVVNVFPLRASGPFWAKLGYVPHEFAAKVLSKPCGCSSAVPCSEEFSSQEPSSGTNTPQ